MTSLDGINGWSIQTLLRGENDSKQSDEFQATYGTNSKSNQKLYDTKYWRCKRCIRRCCNLTVTSKLCLKIKTKRFWKRIKITSNKKWFNRECWLKRHELQKLSNKKHCDPLNSEIWEKFHKTLNDYKNLLNSKRKEFQKEKTEQLGELTLNPDKASFWSCLKSISNTVDDNVPAPILEETWLNYFESLHSNDPKNPIYRQEFYNEMQSLEKEKENSLTC